MAIGAVILAHTHLRRAEQLARALAKSGIKVALHVDGSVGDTEFTSLSVALSGRRNIILTKRVRCDWGRFSLVEAGLSAAAELIEEWPGVSHVLQLSGACLPVKPLKELKAFLRDRPDQDFVESVSFEEDWVQDGLSQERFTLYFPFSWKRHRMLFDAWVEIQRAIGVNRSVPEGISPHLGSQWWCLSRDTLTAILNDPDRPRFDRYFAKCWIPDESYVPTLVRRHSKKLVTKSLTLTRFDDQGKPHMFYDEHAALLRGTDHFFARKIWHGADQLYREFLGRRKAQTAHSLADEFGLELVFKKARARRCNGRKGLRNAGAFPNARYERRPSTACPYHVFLGFGQVFDGFDAWLDQGPALSSYGRIFQAGRVGSLPSDSVFAGCVPANPKVRDIAPEQYLCNLLWSNQTAAQALSLEVADGSRIASFVAQDPNARLVIVEGAWILDLFHRDHQDDEVLKNQAQRLLLQDRAINSELAKAGDAARCERFRLFDLLENLESFHAAIGDELWGKIKSGGALPDLRDLTGFREFLERLSRLGIDTAAIGDLPQALPGEHVPEPLRRAS